MEHFIETVRKYPCLWNTTAIEYRDQELKDAAWAEVMKETDLSSVKEVKQKWKKLRDSYRDALKRQSEMQAKEPGAAVKRAYPWRYTGLMQFLQPYMSNRKKPADAPQPGAPHATHAPLANGHAARDQPSSDDSDSEPDADVEEERPSPSPKRKGAERLCAIDRKLDYLCRVQAKRPCGDSAQPPRPPGYMEVPLGGPAPADPLDIFFSSMCQATKRFGFAAQIKIKKTLFGAVIEAEEALLAEQQSYASLWAQGGASPSTSEPDPPDDDDRKPS